MYCVLGEPPNPLQLVSYMSLPPRSIIKGLQVITGGQHKYTILRNKPPMHI